MPQSEKPREFTLRARFVPGMRVAIPEWVVLATPKAAVPPEDVRVLEADPVERELETLESHLSCARQELNSAHTRIGVLEGERDAASWPGVIDGWREKCERLEAELAETT